MAKVIVQLNDPKAPLHSKKLGINLKDGNDKAEVEEDKVKEYVKGGLLKIVDRPPEKPKPDGKEKSNKGKATLKT